MPNNNPEHLNRLCNYINEAVYEVLTSKDDLSKYQNLIERLAERAEVQPELLKSDLEDFILLYNQVVEDAIVTTFEERSLMTQGKLAYIKEDTIQKLIELIPSSSKSQENKIPSPKKDKDRVEVRLPLINDRQQDVVIDQFIKPNQHFILKGDVICFVAFGDKSYSIKSPVSGYIYLKKEIGERVPFRGLICEISEEQRNGQFDYQWYNHTKYSGDFVDGEISGTGKIEYHNGDIYIGELFKGLKHGNGQLQYVNGDTYKGDWLNNKMYGDGTFIIRSLEGFILFETYKMSHGKATYLLPNGDSATCYFQDVNKKNNYNNKKVVFKDNVVVQTPLRIRQSVSYQKSKPKKESPTQSKQTNDHKAKYFFKNGDQYVGDFVNGLFHGKGTLSFDSGKYPTINELQVKSYKGNFDRGKLHGNIEVELLEAHDLGGFESFKTVAIQGKLITSIIPFATNYEGDIKNGAAKVYIRQLYRYSTNPSVFEATFENFVPVGVVRFNNNTFTYQGEMHNLKLQGKGILTKENLKWQGNFEHNTLHYAKFYQNGNLIYEGGYRNFYLSDNFLNRPNSFFEGVYHGKGKLNKGNQCWEGEFVYGKFKKGIVSCMELSINYTLQDETLEKLEGIYDGDFEDGFPNGKGFFSWNDGKIKGEFKKGYLVQGQVAGLEIRINTPFHIIKGIPGLYEGEYPSGIGIFQSDYGTIEGQFENGNLAQGKFTFSDRTMEGNFKQGQPIGKIKYDFPNAHFIYEGEFQNQQFHGKGKITYINGSSYEGHWQEGKKHGYGTEINTSGEKYEGQYHYDKKQGFGKITLKNGDIYDGHFKNNMFDGNGSLISLNGNVYKGTWKTGKRHGEGTQVLAKEGQTLTGLWEDDELIKDYNKKSLWDKVFKK